MADLAAPLVPWPPIDPFPESRRDSTGRGPDFPANSGERELGRLRPAKGKPRLTAVAVVNADGSDLGGATMQAIQELTFWVRALYAGMVAAETAIDVTDGLLSIE